MLQTKKNCILFLLALSFVCQLPAQDETEKSQNQHPEKKVQHSIKPHSREPGAHRARLFCNAILSVTKKVKRKVTSLLDEMGDLVTSLDCLNTIDEELSGDDFLDQPQSYTELFGVAEQEIRTVIMGIAQMSLPASAGTDCVNQTEADLQQALERFPDYQGAEFHSGMLYQILRRSQMQCGRFQPALATIEMEFNNLPAAFIETNDPQAFVDFAEILEALGRTEDALELIQNRVTRESRPYIQRRAALWRARLHERRGEVKATEDVFIEALLVSQKDPEPYLALIQFYLASGNPEMARALTGVMNRVILQSSQWQEFKGELSQYIAAQLPAELQGINASDGDLLTLIRFWLGRGRFEQSLPYWLPLFREFCSGGNDCLPHQNSKAVTLQTFTVDLPRQLSLTPEARYDYFRLLYQNRHLWVSNIEYEEDIVVEMLFQLRHEFNDDENHQRLVDFLFSQGSGDIYKTRVLFILVRSSMDKPQLAIGWFIQLVRDYYGGNTSSELRLLFQDLAPHMTKEQIRLVLNYMFINYQPVRHMLPGMLDIMLEHLGEQSVSRMLREELATKSDLLNHLETSRYYSLLSDYYGKERFKGSLWEALLSQPKINQAWEELQEKKKRAETAKRKPAGVIQYHYLNTDRTYDRNTRVRNILSYSALPGLLASIGIQTIQVPADGYCMWHALAAGLNSSGHDYGDGLALYQQISPFVAGSSYAPANWGTSDHLAVAASVLSISIMEIHATCSGTLVGTLFHPNQSQTPLPGAANVLQALQSNQSNNIPTVIMINNTSMFANGGLVINAGNHWSAGVYSQDSPATQLAGAGFQGITMSPLMFGLTRGNLRRLAYINPAISGLGLGLGLRKYD